MAIFSQLRRRLYRRQRIHGQEEKHDFQSVSSVIIYPTKTIALIKYGEKEEMQVDVEHVEGHSPNGSLWDLRDPELVEGVAIGYQDEFGFPLGYCEYYPEKKELVCFRE